MLFNRALTPFCALTIGLGTWRVLHGFTSLGDGAFQMIEQAVQIHRHNGGGAYGRQIPAIAEPARTEVPTAFRAGTPVTPDLLPGAVRGLFCGFDLLQPGLLSR